MKKYIGKTVNYLIPFIGGIWFGMFIYIILKIPFDMIFKCDFLGDRIFLSLTLIVSAALLMMFYMKQVGYKSGKWECKDIVVGFLIIFVIQQAIVWLISGYLDQFTGGAQTLCKLFWLGNSPETAENAVPSWGCHVVMFLINLTVYLPISVYGNYLGAKKREKERKSLGI